MVETKPERRAAYAAPDDSAEEGRELQGAAREDVRTKILEATSRIARTEGLDAATPTRIYTATGIARSTVYRHWPKRVELLRAAIEGDAQRPLGEKERAATASGALRLAAESFAEESFVRMLASVMGRADAGGKDADPEWRVLAKRLLRSRLGAFFDYIDGAHQAGRVHDGLGTDQLIALCLGPMLYHRMIFATQIPEELIARQIRLLEGLIDEATEGSEAHRS